MIVTRYNFHDTLRYLERKHTLSLDTETTGLRPYHGDEFFSIIMHDGEQAYYFNFNDGFDIPEEAKLESPEMRAGMRSFLASEPTRLWYMHHAKYDLAILRAAGWEVAGTIHDTMAIARLLDSTLMQNQFSLDACAARIGYKKDDIVKKYLLAMPMPDGGRRGKKDLPYSLVPWDLIVPYGEKDAEITFKLGEYQRVEIHRTETPPFNEPLATVYANEVSLTRVVSEMEALGVLVDSAYCQRAVAHTARLQEELRAEFKNITGENFVDSSKVFQRVFQSESPHWVYGEPTPTGKVNPSFDSDVLQTFEHPAAKLVLKHRSASSDHNYYLGFLENMDKNNVIHANFNQHGTATGRFSSSNPNLQNLTKVEDEDLKQEFVVRRAIIPRPGMVFHMLDYDQMEYRLLLEYAAKYACAIDGVLALIEKVKAGLDVHMATAEIAGITRKEAKTTNFATIYGSGNALLGKNLGVSVRRAAEIRAAIFRAAPEIELFLGRASQTARNRKFLVNWLGRRTLFPDSSWAYRGPNYIIQGGCADVVKRAMVEIHEFTQPFRTRIALMIHDELVMEGPPEEAAFVIPEVKRIMESVYKGKYLTLTCGVEHSFKSLADKEEGVCRL